MAANTRQAAPVPALKADMVIGDSSALRGIYELLPRIAETDSSVLIWGESGTGKELLAREIYHQSPRAGGPFITVCCAALPDTLLESELFGHEKGAFTDAFCRRLGRFELAHRGVIFLDEVAEMSPAMQAKLLRVLQERDFERLGGSETIKVDVRVISATNRDPKEATAKGLFRADLYFRLNVVPLFLPPLRERQCDIVLLCDHFIARFNRTMGKKVRAVSVPALRMLENYPWPGNIRELENCLERAMILAQGEEIGPEHLCWPGGELRADLGALASLPAESPLEIAERREIEHALRQANWNRSRAAAALKLSRKTLYHKIKRYGLVPEPATYG
jgi:transcriptional regulator with PAS, ATPase and Fis domain